jgi:hypothetical protein
VSPNATVELLRSAINIVSCQSETVNKFVELMDKKLDLKDADRLPLGLDATPKIPMPRESRPYYYADNLIYQYRVLWDNAHYAGVGAEMFDRKYGELLTSLRKAYPDETAKVTSRIVTELKKKGPLGDFGHMPADKKKALIAIMTEQPQKPKYVSAGYQPPAQLP